MAFSSLFDYWVCWYVIGSAVSSVPGTSWSDDTRAREGMLLGSTDGRLETIKAMLWVDGCNIQKGSHLMAALISLQRGSLRRDHDPGIHMLNERNWGEVERLSVSSQFKVFKKKKTLIRLYKLHKALVDCSHATQFSPPPFCLVRTVFLCSPV